jgi:hypothetical protein
VERQLEILKNDFCILRYVAEKKAIVCVAVKDYIPIEIFKETFEHAAEFASEQRVKYFIFNKINLRTFHQPSMEWYFTIWKPIMKSRGVDFHYKILPELEWFKKAVEAGKYEIENKYSKSFLDGITIKYVKSEAEALNEIEI